MGRGGTMNKVIFFGTPDYVIPVLDALKRAKYDITAVVTRAPKPVGRRQILTSSPVALWATKNNIPVFSPKKLDEEFISNIKHLTSNINVAILAAFGRIIPQALIDAFPYGIINIHPSLLPKYRGASPIEAALVAGEKQTGVTIIKLDAELDHGPIISQFVEPIKEDDTRVTLRERLFQKAAQNLVEILPHYVEGRISLKEQNHAKATFTNLMKKEDGFIPPQYLASCLQGVALEAQWPIPFIKDFTIHPSPITIYNFIRAVNPWPGAFTSVKLKVKIEKLEKKLKILKAHVVKNTSGVDPDSPEVDGSTRLVPDLVQLEGKTPVSWQQFQAGYPNFEF